MIYCDGNLFFASDKELIYGHKRGFDGEDIVEAGIREQLPDHFLAHCSSQAERIYEVLHSIQHTWCIASYRQTVHGGDPVEDGREWSVELRPQIIKAETSLSLYGSLVALTSNMQKMLPFFSTL